MMTAQQFTDSVDRTLYKDGRPMPLEFAVLGLCGEGAEATKAACAWAEEGSVGKYTDLVKEVGDVCWYVAACARALGSSFADVWLLEMERAHIWHRDAMALHAEDCLGTTVDAYLACGAFADKIKKRCWHGRIYDNQELLTDLAKILFHLAWALEEPEITWSEVYVANKEKLEKRYPTGFVERFPHGAPEGTP